MMSDPTTLRQAILKRLSSVIDPETGVDVVRMRLVEALDVDDAGRVSYTFRPSSPFCPLAVSLAIAVKTALAGVPGVTQQTVQVSGYVQADELTEMVNEFDPASKGQRK
jgi:metal-sulfur cluster biosynthetic enzyme